MTNAVCFENESWVGHFFDGNFCYQLAVNKKHYGNKLISVFKKLRRHGAPIPYKRTDILD